MNQLSLSASVVQVQTLRYTPAGIPALNIVLEHESQVVEMGTARQVKVQLRAVAFGAHAETLARYLGTVLQGMAIQANNGATSEQLRQVAEMTLLAFPR